MSIPPVSEASVTGTDLTPSTNTCKMQDAAKRRFQDDPNPRITKQIRVSKSPLHLEVHFPEGVDSARYTLEVVLVRSREEIEPLTFPEKYAEKKTDTILTFDGGRSICVHREVLTEKSEYFAALFSSRWQGNEDNQAQHLKQIPFEHASQILQYLYNDELMLSLENVLWVYDMAQKWGIDCLSERCRQYLGVFYHPDRWHELLSYESIFWEQIVDYVSANAYVIFKRDEIAALPKHMFMEILTHAELNVPHVKNKMQAFLKWAKINCPPGTLLKDYVKSVSDKGVRFFDVLGFEKSDVESVCKVFGKEDLLTLHDVYQLVSVESRDYMVSMDGDLNSGKHLRIPKFYCFSNVWSNFSRNPSTWFWKIAASNLEDGYSSEFLSKSLSNWRAEFQIQIRIWKGHFCLHFDQLQSSEKKAVHERGVRFTLLNQFDLRKNIAKRSEGAAMISMEDLQDPDQGWIVNGELFVALEME